MLKWVAICVVGWLLLSLVLFMVSAQLEGGVSDEAEQALSGGGNFLTGQHDPRARLRRAHGDTSSPTRAGARPRRHDPCSCTPRFGRVRKLSIPRDSEAEIPGHGAQKINAAYALGGPALMIETVEASSATASRSTT